jgi:hypothetical protein
MKTKNLIYIGIGGVIAYLLLKNRSNKQAQEQQLGEDESGVIQGVFVGSQPSPMGVPISGNYRPSPLNRGNYIGHRGSRATKIEVPKAKRPSLIGKELPKFRTQRTPNLFGIQVPTTISNIFKPKIIDVYYANLERITPLEVFTPVRYRERISGTALIGNIYVSSIDENNNMIWKNEKTGQLVNIIYPTR